MPGMKYRANHQADQNPENEIEQFHGSSFYCSVPVFPGCQLSQGNEVSSLLLLLRPV
jgi:hypothetical protein